MLGDVLSGIDAEFEVRQGLCDAQDDFSKTVYVGRSTELVCRELEAGKTYEFRIRCRQATRSAETVVSKSSVYVIPSVILSTLDGKIRSFPGLGVPVQP